MLAALADMATARILYTPCIQKVINVNAAAIALKAVVKIMIFLFILSVTFPSEWDSIYVVIALLNYAKLV